jgi:hypothetical protein
MHLKVRPCGSGEIVIVLSSPQRFKSIMRNGDRCGKAITSLAAEDYVCVAIAVAKADSGTCAGVECVAEEKLDLTRDRFFVRAYESSRVQARKNADGASATRPLRSQVKEKGRS